MFMVDDNSPPPQRTGSRLEPRCSDGRNLSAIPRTNYVRGGHRLDPDTPSAKGSLHAKSKQELGFFFSSAPGNPRVSMGSPRPICMPLIARRKGKLILHGKGNRRPMAIKPPMQEKMISSRMENPNKSDQNGKCAKYRPLPWGNPPPAILTCKNGKSNLVLSYPRRNSLSSFSLSVLRTYHLFLCVENIPPTSNCAENKHPSSPIPALTKGNSAFVFPLFYFVYISSFLFVENVPNHHPWRLQIVVRFRFRSLLNTKWILDLAPIDWVGHCQRCTFSISCT